LVGCQAPAPFIESDGAPSNHVDLSGVPDAVPKAQPLSDLGNHSPYVVLGKRYRVLPSAAGYQATGIASWYGSKFHGRLTSSGQPYDMYRMTAAHRSLPIPSFVEVKNLDNGRRVVVEINDRGPFRDGRIIDLSYAAAVRLGFVHEGVTRVRLEALEPPAAIQVGTRGAGEPWVSQASVNLARVGSTSASSNEAASPRRMSGDSQRMAGSSQRMSGGSQRIVGDRLFLQAGAFATPEAAADFSDVLKDVVGDRVRIVRFPSQDELHRVRVGPIGDLEEASRLQALIITADLGVPLIIYD
jgi:rare lipoprotein A